MVDQSILDDVTLNTIINRALDYAKDGFHVFPFLQRCKNDKNKIGTPIGWNHNKPDDPNSIPSTIDTDIISAWPVLYPDIIGYGVNPRNRRAIVLDVDIKDGRLGAESLKALQRDFKISLDTKIVRSKSGGFHLYYAYDGVPDGFYVKGTGLEGYPHIDLRTDNSFVVGPDESRYKLIRESPLAKLPPTLVPLLPLESLRKSSLVVDCQDARALSYVDESLRGSVPESIPLGVRDNTLIKLIGSWCRKGLEKDLVIALTELAISRCERKLGDTLHIRDYIPKIETTLAKSNFLPNISDKLQWLIDHLYYIERANAVFNAQSRRVTVVAHASNMYANFVYYVEREDGKKTKVSAFKQWIESPKRQTMSSFGYHPNKPAVCYDNVQCCEVCNTYEEPFTKITPVADDVRRMNDRGATEAFTVGGLFEEFCRYLFGPDHEFMIDWAAHQVQHPDKKLCIAPVMVSKVRGVGKNLFFDLVRAAIGNNNATDADVTEVVDKHCEFAIKHHLVLINETNIDARDRMSKNMRNNTIERLKAKISDNKQTVEPKFIPRFNVQSYVNYIIATNNLDAVPIEQGDRRFYVVNISASKMPRWWYIPLWKVVDDIGLAFHLRQWLMARSIQRVQVGQTATAINAAKRMMIDAAKSHEQLVLEDAVEDRYSIFRSDVITIELFTWYVRTKMENGTRLSTGAIQALFRTNFMPVITPKSNDRAIRPLVDTPPRFVDGAMIPGEKKRCGLYSVRNHSNMATCSTDWLVANYKQSLAATAHDFVEKEEAPNVGHK